MFVLLALRLAVPAAFASPEEPAATPGDTLPASLQGKAVVLGMDDPDFARAVVSNAVQPAGMGGVSEAVVLRITEDIPVWRMWNGPDKVDANGRTNRLGQWWTADPPKGRVSDYRVNYEVCVAWNDLTWVERCTLKAGAVVAAGPGQSVSAETCGDPSGEESYPASPRHWQVFIATPWTRMPAELDCPPETADYKANPKRLERPAKR
jgi:hypothetical protein